MTEAGAILPQGVPNLPYLPSRNTPTGAHTAGLNTAKPQDRGLANPAGGSGAAGEWTHKKWRDEVTAGSVIARAVDRVALPAGVTPPR